MEAEERPAKLQKTHHVYDDTEAMVSEADPTLNAPSTQNASELQNSTDPPPPSEPVGVAKSPDHTASATASETRDFPATSTEPAAKKAPKPRPSDFIGLPTDPPPPGLSKSALKKLRKAQEWEAGREDRKVKRRLKIKAAKERKRAARAAEAEANPEAAPLSQTNRMPRIQVPVTVIFDCSFDGLMKKPEYESLAAQITRAYSDVRKGVYRPHLAVSSFGARLKERFDGLLRGAYKNWTNVRFFDEDVVEVAEMAKEWMGQKGGGVVRGPIAKPNVQKSNVDGDAQKSSIEQHDREPSKEGVGCEGPSKGAPPAPESPQREVVYLTADSPNTLDRLSPHGVYIIGGLVDRNRHKGICYKRACDKGIKTARLPIGEYLKTSSRPVLATNHVNEIIVKWLESGDWEDAFTKVMPQRKSENLKGRKGGKKDSEEHVESDESEEDNEREMTEEDDDD